MPCQLSNDVKKNVRRVIKSFDQTFTKVWPVKHRQGRRRQYVNRRVTRHWLEVRVTMTQLLAHTDAYLNEFGAAVAAVNAEEKPVIFRQNVFSHYSTIDKSPFCIYSEYL